MRGGSPLVLAAMVMIATSNVSRFRADAVYINPCMNVKFEEEEGVEGVKLVQYVTHIRTCTCTSTYTYTYTYTYTCTYTYTHVIYFLHCLERSLL